MATLTTPPPKTHRVTLVQGEYYGIAGRSFLKGQPADVSEDLAARIAEKHVRYTLTKPDGSAEEHRVDRFKIERIGGDNPVAAPARTRHRAPAQTEEE